MKKFQRRIEDFVCQKCEREVKGDGYTNHCPNCLWSRHVDINPGDRASDCRGMMKPVSHKKSGEEISIIHKCQKCETQKSNKVSPKDTFDKILEI